MKNNLCLIVPTKDHPGLLKRFLGSVRIQTVKPDLVIIVDGGDTPAKDITSGFSDLPLKYLRVRPPGLTRQRNAGIKSVSADINLIAFLDDDIVFYEDAVERMLIFWSDKNGKVGGAAFNIVNHEAMAAERFLFLRKIFYLSNGFYGDILPSGIGTSLFPVKETYQSKWLCGGATVWRKEVLQDFFFDEWLSGYGIVDDLDFSYRVSRHFSLFVVADSRVLHLQIPKRNYFLASKIMVVNHFYFISKNPEFSKAKLLWAYAGKVLLRIYRLVSAGKTSCLQESLGLLVGMILAIQNKLPRINKNVS